MKPTVNHSKSQSLRWQPVRQSTHNQSASPTPQKRALPVSLRKIKKQELIAKAVQSECSSESQSIKCANCERRDHVYAQALSDIILEVENLVVSLQVWRRSQTYELEPLIFRNTVSEDQLNQDYCGCKIIECRKTIENFIQETISLTKDISSLSKVSIWDHVKVVKQNKSNIPVLSAIREAKSHINTLKSSCTESFDFPHKSNNETIAALQLMLQQSKRERRYLEVNQSLSPGEDLFEVINSHITDLR